MNLLRHEVGPRLSQAAVFGDVVYLAGQVPSATLALGIKEQTREVLDRVDTLLRAVGSDKSHILFCQIFLRNIDDFQAMNEVWDGWVAAGSAPPRATVQAFMARPETLIEVVVAAARAGFKGSV